MALKNKMFAAMLLIFTPVIHAKIVLPELLAKQSLDNIRFLSQDGKFTYYQKRSGSLLFSSNYKVQEMIKGEVGTQYTVFATNARKKIVITQNLNYHTFYSLRAKEKIFLADFGESIATEVGKGIAPTLLLNDTWLSYYDPYSKILSFESTTNSALKFSIKLNNRINPYFLPQVIMADDNTVYYTDLSENGSYGILEFKRNTQKSELIFKSPTPMEKVEMCFQQDKLIIGIFGINFSKSGSSISSIEYPFKSISKRDILYKSELNDLGHLVCSYENGSIAFIKNYGTDSSPGYDVAELSLSKKTITQLSELKTVSNIIDMDKTLLTLEKGHYLILKGESDYKSVDTLKAKNDLKNPPPVKSKEDE